MAVVAVVVVVVVVVGLPIFLLILHFPPGRRRDSPQICRSRKVVL